MGPKLPPSSNHFILQVPSFHQHPKYGLHVQVPAQVALHPSPSIRGEIPEPPGVPARRSAVQYGTTVLAAGAPPGQ
eukprot:513987-Hanusia_phi.AAC.1